MATVRPFRGIRYNPQKIGDYAAVTTPPYDVISPEEQNAFHARHPYNVIRLILGAAGPGDMDGDNPHSRSADYFRRWLAEGVLQQDERPSVYLKSIAYTHAGRSVTRYGLIALVGIEPFHKRIILPHERTFSKVRSERLQLMKATHCNFCPIFALYPDDGDIMGHLIRGVEGLPPEADFTDDQGHRHRLWTITGREVHQRIADAMRDRRLFIADGHHRYETALNFRTYLERTDPAFNDRHPANYVMMYLCSMSDPGLIILPAHRLIKALDRDRLDRAIDAARTYFEITGYRFGANDRQAVQSSFLKALEADREGHCFGIYSHGRPVLHRLTLKAGVMDRLYAEELDASLRSLDVSVLTRLFFMQLLGFDRQRLDNETLIGYASTAERALKAIDDHAYDAAFIINPTRIEQVQEVAQKGLIMPRKSTYFYPKVKSGLVMHTLRG